MITLGVLVCVLIFFFRNFNIKTFVIINVIALEAGSGLYVMLCYDRRPS